MRAALRQKPKRPNITGRRGTLAYEVLVRDLMNSRNVAMRLQMFATACALNQAIETIGWERAIQERVVKG